MNRALRRNCLVWVLPLLAGVGGCASTRLDRFPDFPAHKSRLGGTVIITDFLVMRATNTDTPMVDVAANKIIADTLLAYVQDVLDAKGFVVGGRILSSVGLLLDDDFTAILARGGGQAAPDPEMAGMAIYSHPPFYLYQALRRDTTLRNLMAGMYRTLLRLEDAGDAYPAVNEIVSLRKVLGGGMIFVFMGGGYEVPPGIGQEAVSGPPTSELTKIGFHSISQASLYLYVLDGGTGEILWTDHQIRKGGTMYKDKFIQMAGEILGDLP